ncbi:unnamed protein product, partial [Mycena citricolor]
FFVLKIIISRVTEPPNFRPDELIPPGPSPDSMARLDSTISDSARFYRGAVQVMVYFEFCHRRSAITNHHRERSEGQATA